MPTIGTGLNVRNVLLKFFLELLIFISILVVCTFILQMFLSVSLGNTLDDYRACRMICCCVSIQGFDILKRNLIVTDSGQEKVHLVFRRHWDSKKFHDPHAVSQISEGEFVGNCFGLT